MLPQTAEHRASQLALRTATVRDLLRLWPALDVARLDSTYPAWAQVAGILVNRNRRMSAALAARYLRSLSDFDPLMAGDVDPEQLAVVLRTTSVVSVKNAMTRGDPLERAARKAFVLSSGASARLVLDAGRETVTRTVQADPMARGYRRVLGGGGCQFCRMLAGRGAVYGEDSASFEAHDACGCTAEPVYE